MKKIYFLMLMIAEFKLYGNIQDTRNIALYTFKNYNENDYSIGILGPTWNYGQLGVFLENVTSSEYEQAFRSIRWRSKDLELLPVEYELFGPIFSKVEIGTGYAKFMPKESQRKDRYFPFIDFDFIFGLSNPKDFLSELGIGLDFGISLGLRTNFHRPNSASSPSNSFDFMHMAFGQIRF